MRNIAAFFLMMTCLFLGHAHAAKKPAPEPAPEPEQKVICPKKLPKIIYPKRSEVYKGVPYLAGERAEYKVSYMGAHVGNGVMEVRAPILLPAGKKKAWHRSFHVEAKTGNWYRLIFVAHDQLNAYVRPWDMGVSRFYMKQDEDKALGRRLQQEKWLEFDHDKCKVQFKRTKVGKKDRTAEYDVAYGSMDTLGVAYWLRQQNYKLNKKIRGLVYSSENSWWLEANPVAFEDIKTEAGTFKAVKLNLQTYIGQELQQKGDVDVWIDVGTESKPLLQVKAEIKLGSVWIELIQFKKGR